MIAALKKTQILRILHQVLANMRYLIALGPALLSAGNFSDLPIPVVEISNEHESLEQLCLKYKTTDSVVYLLRALEVLEESKQGEVEGLTGYRRLQKHLMTGNQTLVYFGGNSSTLYLIGLSPKGHCFKPLDIEKSRLEAIVHQLNAWLKSSPEEPAVFQLRQLAKRSNQLYDLLLAPIRSIATARLIVVTDSVLEKVPFSLLLTTSVNVHTIPFDDWPFAIHRHSFSLAHSLDMLFRAANENARFTNRSVLAFAPAFWPLDNGFPQAYAIPEIQHNVAEIAYISQYFNCEPYIGTRASLSVFKRLAKDYPVLHLATHTAQGPDRRGAAHLVFASAASKRSQLTAKEICDMDIPAELVVLSACETSLKNFSTAFGKMSIGRAFLQAGAQCLLATQWKISDRASAALMRLFYKKLASGLPKDVALQQAQLTFMKTQEKWLSHPFFWAAFVLRGDTAPLELNPPEKPGNWLWGMAFFLCAPCFYYFKVRCLK